MTKPNAELLPQFSEHEEAILEIAFAGDPVAPIGHWKQPVENLINRGFLTAALTITKAGEQAYIEVRNNLVRQLKPIGDAHERCREIMEQAAQMLASVAVVSSKATGDDPHKAMGRWVTVLEDRARSLIQNKQAKPLPEK